MLSFLGSMARSLGAEVSTSEGIPKGDGASVGVFMGKAVGSLLFAETACYSSTVLALGR
jgi:hypothetical protein